MAAGVRWLRHLHHVATGAHGPRAAAGQGTDEGTGECSSAANVATGASRPAADQSLSSSCKHKADAKVATGTGGPHSMADAAKGGCEHSIAGASSMNAASHAPTAGAPAHCRSHTCMPSASPDISAAGSRQQAAGRSHLEGVHEGARALHESQRNNNSAPGDCHRSSEQLGHGRKQSAVDSDNDASWQQQARDCGSVAQWFQALVRAHFHGTTKPPFNVEARSAAGFPPEWYEPLATCH